MEQFALNYHSSFINCHRFGEGTHLVICFPGYGETGNAFSLFSGPGTEGFRFCCVDLPFHGGTDWKENRPFLSSDLLAIRDQLLDMHDHGRSGYSLIGFSLGGRVAMQLYQADPSKVRRLLLLAPDGLRPGFWFSFSTGTWIGNRIFRLIMFHRKLLPQLLVVLKKTRLVDKSRLRFIENYLHNPESRKLVYKRWTAFGKMKPSRSRIRQLILQNKTITRLVYGKFDRVIPSKDGEIFNATIQPYGTITVLDCGHQLIVPKNRDAIIAAITG